MLEIQRSLIVSKYRSLFNDGETDIIYIGKNINNQTIIGSIMDEDRQYGELRYLHSIISQEIKKKFLNREITYRQVLGFADEIFSVLTNYRNTDLVIGKIELQDIDPKYLPTQDSFLPTI